MGLRSCVSQYLSRKSRVHPPALSLTLWAFSTTTHVAHTALVTDHRALPGPRGSRKDYIHSNVAQTEIHLLAVAGCGAGTVPGCQCCHMTTLYF